MRTLYKLLQSIGVFFDPERDGLANPWTGQRTEKRQTKPPEPDNIVYDKHGGRARTYTEDRDNSVMIWEDYNPDSAERTAEYTQQDKEVIQEWAADSIRPNLSERNYRILKPLYAEGISAKKAACHAVNKNGPDYSVRTLDKYWAAMAAASARRKEAKTPTPANQGA